MEDKRAHIPRLYHQLFKWFCKDSIYAELQGDLVEEFHMNVKEFGPVKARILYRKEVLRMIRPSVLKKFKSQTTSQNSISMYSNFIKVAFRSLSKNRLFTFINITGLAIGMSVALLIVNLVFDVAKFDQFHEHKDRLYRVISTPMQTGYHRKEGATTPMPLAEKMKAEVPGIETVSRIRRRFTGRLKIDDKNIFAEGIYADANFFDVFTFEMERGNPETALDEPFSIVLTKTLAEKLRPGVDLMGKVINIPERGEFLVTGIMADPPGHSHFKFDMISTMGTAQILEQQGKIAEATDDWRDFNHGYVYFLMEKGQSLDYLQSWLTTQGTSLYEAEEHFYARFALQKVTQIIPGKNLNDQLGAEMPALPIIILGAIAMLILMSACFNYTNLSIARALRRSKEIGVRKIVGSSKGQIFSQFTIETIIVSLVSVLFSMLLFMVIKPLFISSIPRIDEVMQPETPPVLIGVFILFALFIGFFAGIFPALFFSRIQPLLALRSPSSVKLFSKVNLRKVLIIVQFSISIFFLITMNVVLKQHRYTMAYDMGFREENLVNLELQNNDALRLLTELEKVPEINGLSASSMILGSAYNNRIMVKNPATNDSTGINFISANPSFFELHEVPVVAGATYPKRAPGEQLNKIMVNEAFVRFYGFDSPQAILGEQYIVSGKPVTITGVIKDINYQFIEEAIHPLVLLESPKNYRFVNASIQGGDIVTTLDKIETAWAEVDAENDMVLTFMDEQLAETSGFLIIFTRVFGFLGLIAASIACLGLLGMAVFNAETRTKEIGIRKAVGASVSNLIMILSKSFVKWISIAGVLGGTLAYLVLQSLVLPEIHYHVNVGLLEVLSALLILLSLAILAVGSQTWKAARANPVDALRYE